MSHDRNPTNLLSRRKIGLRNLTGIEDAIELLIELQRCDSYYLAEFVEGEKIHQLGKHRLP